jgi:hypothetical protein
LHPKKFVTVLLAQFFVDGFYRMKEDHPQVSAVSLGAEDCTVKVFPSPIIERPK